MFNYLKYDKWSCSDVFWYAGRINSSKHEKEREKIENIGYKIKDKLTKFYKKLPISTICPKCDYKFEYLAKGNKLPKANCDVELTVDCLELAGPDTESLIFTGDGDFKYLIEKLITKGSKVYLFSTKGQDRLGDYRFSTRYDDLLKDGRVTFLEMNNLKHRLRKDLPEQSLADISTTNKETAAKRDGPERLI